MHALRHLLNTQPSSSVVPGLADAQAAPADAMASDLLPISCQNFTPEPLQLNALICCVLIQDRQPAATPDSQELAVHLQRHLVLSVCQNQHNCRNRSGQQQLPAHQQLSALQAEQQPGSAASRYPSASCTARLCYQGGLLQLSLLDGGSQDWDASPPQQLCCTGDFLMWSLDEAGSLEVRQHAAS